MFFKRSKDYSNRFGFINDYYVVIHRSSIELDFEGIFALCCDRRNLSRCFSIDRHPGSDVEFPIRSSFFYELTLDKIEKVGS